MSNSNSETFPIDREKLRELTAELAQIHLEMTALEARALPEDNVLQTTNRQSARNLVHYMALRRHDIRQLQEELTALGLSSLGRSEAHIKLSIEMLLALLHRLGADTTSTPDNPEKESAVANWKALLEEHAVNLLGPKPSHRDVRIMVTMPSEAADDYQLVRDLVSEGMDCMRINCAHDDVTAWGRMASNLERARKATGRDCRILMDVPGPKLRTGPIEPGPRVVKWRPHRDRFGRVLKPAKIWLSQAGAEQEPPARADACLPVNADWLAKTTMGDVLRFYDTRGASRRLIVSAVVGECRWAESYQTSYVAPGTTIHNHRTSHGSGSSLEQNDHCAVGDIAPRIDPIVLKQGNTLVLTRELIPGRPAQFDDRGEMIAPARIGVTLPEIFSDVRPGEAIWLDDGKIGGRIRTVSDDEIHVEITQAAADGAKLSADKGINLPDSDLRLPALTEFDIECLDFISTHADLVGYSFVRKASDVYELQDRLERLGGRKPGIILKIETRTAFERLPELLLAAMRSPAAGVMIARGDLAVECGYERLAEVQEEILWVCEAAHMPVIWATQVLENLAKGGMPSRAEITDAAMGERAECVMLNKGPYVVEAVKTLDNILRRMQAHQAKKKATLRSLRIADKFKAASR